ncbi:MAG TPA: nucleotide exchange factor GrpE [Clostridia bacterium]|nr:nucleotide exchange factor GrpE [Clostridia bacterium]
MTTTPVNQKTMDDEANEQTGGLSQRTNNYRGQANPDSPRSDELKAQLAIERDSYLRLAADFENFKKRTARESERRALELKDGFIQDVLPVVDILERALAGSSSTSSGTLHEGIQLTLQQFFSVLKRHGLEPELPLGQPFDPHRHEAVGVRSNPAFANGAVLEVWQRGWRRRDDVFRYAKVIVNDLESTPPRQAIL